MKVSVALCTYNGEKYIEKQLNSIIHQTRRVDEIIVCDDCSSDDTLKIVEEMLLNSSISYTIKKNKDSLGVVRNFEKCYSLCSGDVIFSSDQDDIWREDKVEVILNYFELYPNIDLIATNAILINADDVPMSMSLREGLLFDAEKEEFNLFPKLLKQYCVTGATMALRKTFFEQYYFISEYWLHDGALALIAGVNDALLYLDEKLTLYRLHGNNVCGIGNANFLQTGTVEQVKKQYRKRTLNKILKLPFYYQDYAFDKYQMYNEILERKSLKKLLNNYNREELNRCATFWKERCQIQNICFRYFLKQRSDWQQHGCYDKYIEDNCFYYTDIYFWFIYHMFRSKCRKFTDIHDK